MRVAFVGKGGSGKTTLSSLFARYTARAGGPVVAIDADINQHLGLALGLSPARLPAPLGAGITAIKDYLRGDNPRIPSAAAMVKTTPPGSGSRLITIDDPYFTRHHTTTLPELGGLALMITGPFNEDDLGVACYHSKVGAVELYLNHLIDGPGEHVIVDMTAGGDSFASGMFTRFDMTYLVAEPTRQGIGVYHQYAEHARDYQVPLAVIGNKIHTPEDVDFLRRHVGDALLVTLPHSPAIRAMEQGHPFTLDDLEPQGHHALAILKDHLDATPKDWAKFGRQTIEFHTRNAHAWANRATGQDLLQQIDHDFVYGRRPTLATG
ncbi:ATP-binding protein [Sphaerisporangium krabiense]|uniref:CO dehydrogenase maturation factor n=2 Tax=Sphaerisporangium krabiense TaxID=763782 RepID=A0A7W8ZB57_9ACTN|nr:ATP-binding protein [Sphaerisporangium krabiense]MBB5630680.1 CO dehydrogenase maturation factor [Sphaerisporangium krabiense]